LTAHEEGSHVGVAQGVVVTAPGDLRQLVVSAANRHALGGLAVGVVRGADLDFSECLGVADPTSRPVEIDTVSDCAKCDRYQAAHLPIPYHWPNVSLMPHSGSKEVVVARLRPRDRFDERYRSLIRYPD
jgi:hypothetical protein